MDGRSRPARLAFPFALMLLSIGCRPGRTPEEAEAIALVERLGGRVKSDDARSSRPVVEVALGGTRITDAELARLVVFTQLQTLSLFDTAVSDEGLEHLASLVNLQTLYLGRTRITEAGLQRLAVGQAFQPDIPGARAERQAGKPELRPDAGLGKLQTLGLSDTPISDASIDVLARFAALRSVNLRRTRVTAAGAARLRQSRPDLIVHF
ncbi:MAG TPA: hypothetical protein VJ783_26080 [Pirellulales bacterium]|nr:hypothetical protein [Pirellulales bacterium]